MYVLPRLNERSVNMSHVIFQATDLITILLSRKPCVEIYAIVTVNFDLLTIVRPADASFARDQYNQAAGASILLLPDQIYAA